jgi:hypothetical protein
MSVSAAPVSAATEPEGAGELRSLIRALAQLDIISPDVAERLARIYGDTSEQESDLAVSVRPPEHDGTHYMARAGSDITGIGIAIENVGSRPYTFASSTCPVSYNITGVGSADSVYDTATTGSCPVQRAGTTLRAGERIQRSVTHEQAAALAPGRYRFAATAATGAADSFVFRVIPRFHHEADTDVLVLNPKIVSNTWSKAGNERLPIEFVIINDGGGGTIGDTFSWQLRLIRDGEVVLTRGARTDVPSPFRGREEQTSIAAAQLNPGHYTLELELDTQREVDEPRRNRGNNIVRQQFQVVQ